MRFGSRGSWTLALLLFGAGCTYETPIGPGQKRLVVHAVLDLGARNQTIRLTYSDTGDYNLGVIAGAQVTITTPDGIIMVATPDTATPLFGTSPETLGYRISLDTYGVSLVPGGTYTLHVHTPAGEDATGTTTIPQATAATVPSTEEPFARLTDTLRLTWPTVVGAQSYELRVLQLYEADDGTLYSYGPAYVAFTTGPRSLAGTAVTALEEHELFVSGYRAVVMVSAVDANYYDYYRVLSDPFTGAAPSRLSGAVGVFGSIVPIVVRRLMVH